MPQYLAITIGPIIRTLTQAKKTRELWGASFTFSYISRGIIRELISGNILKINAGKIINPGREDHFATMQKGAGLYPDRIMVLLDDIADKKETIEKVNRVILKVIKGLTDEISETGTNEVLTKYLQVYCIIVDLHPDENVFETLNEKLSCLELQERLEQPWNDQYPITAFTDDANGAVFLRDAFQGYGTNFTFRSLPEISTIDLKEYRKSDEATEEIWTKTYEEIAP